MDASGFPGDVLLLPQGVLQGVLLGSAGLPGRGAGEGAAQGRELQGREGGVRAQQRSQVLSVRLLRGARLPVVRHGPHLLPRGSFGIKVGSIIWLVNVVLLTTYSLSCHSLRHVLGGNKDCYTCVRGGNTRRQLYNGISRLNLRHPQWAWYSLFSVLLTDVYFRLIQAGVIPDLTILG